MEQQKKIGAFPGDIIVASSCQEAANALKFFKGEKILGIDSEWRPAFQKGQESNPTAIFQVSSEKYCILMQLLFTDGFPGEFADILEDPTVVKVGCTLKEDLERLEEEYSISPKNVVDLSQEAKKLGHYKTGLKNMGKHFLGANVAWKKPKIQTSNWQAKELTKEQCIYAASDAWLCRELYVQTPLGVGTTNIGGAPAPKPEPKQTETPTPAPNSEAVNNNNTPKVPLTAEEKAARAAERKEKRQALREEKKKQKEAEKALQPPKADKAEGVADEGKKPKKVKKSKLEAQPQPVKVAMNPQDKLQHLTAQLAQYQKTCSDLTKQLEAALKVQLQMEKNILDLSNEVKSLKL